jgi:chitodextrinase
MANRLARALVPSLLLCLLFPGIVRSELRHFVFGLTPSAGLDVRRDDILIHQNVQASEAGSLTYSAEGAGSFEIVPAGSVDTEAPAAITDLAVQSSGAGSVTLSWTATGDDGSTGMAARYDLRYATSEITERNFAIATPVSGEPSPGAAGQAESLTVTGLAPDSTYWFVIRVLDEAGNASALSASVAVIVPDEADSAPPLSPSDLEASWNGTAVVLAWEASPSLDVEGYRVLRRPIDRVDPQELADSVLVTTFVDQGVVRGMRYGYTIVARDRAGNLSFPTTEIGFEVPPENEPAPGVGRAELLGLWPNPTSGPLRIAYALPAYGRARISLHDVTGRLCARVEGPPREAGRWEWELSDLRGVAQCPLPPGVYFLDLEIGAVKISRRVVLVRGT